MSTLSTPPPPTPEEERVRRLLADARHTEPLPDDVADRLDRVLAGLGPVDVPAEPVPPDPAGPATDLDAARRRRRARTWLAAAAAIAVLGVGVDQLAPDAGSGSGDATSSDAGGSSGATAQEQDSAAPDSSGGGASADLPHQAFGVVGAVPLRSDRFATQVARLRDSALLDRAARQGGPANDERLTRDDLNAQVAKCVGGRGPGRFLPVRYDGEAGVLLYRPVRGDTQVVDLFLCGQDEATRSITLPAR